MVPEETHRTKMLITVSHARVVGFLGDSYFLLFVRRNGGAEGRKESSTVFLHPHLRFTPTTPLQPHSGSVLILFDLSPVFHFVDPASLKYSFPSTSATPWSPPLPLCHHFSCQLCEIIFLSPSFPLFPSGFCPQTFPFLNLITI